MFFRKSALPLVEEWRRVIKTDPTRLWDQGEFNRIARQKWDPGRTSGFYYSHWHGTPCQCL